MVEYGTQVYQAGQGNLQCGQRFKTKHGLQYHIQICHTKEGIKKKFKSEKQLEAFFKDKGVVFQQQVHVSWSQCPQLQLGGKAARPDFLVNLPGVNATILVGNDEMRHRQYACDFKRTIKLAATLTPKHPTLVYVRFNPHYYYRGDSLYDQSLKEGHRRIWDILTTKLTNLQPGLNLIYVNYDQVETDDPELWKRLKHYVEVQDGDENFQNRTLLQDCVVGVY